MIIQFFLDKLRSLDTNSCIQSKIFTGMQCRSDYLTAVEFAKN